MGSSSVRIRARSFYGNIMTPDQQEALNAHVQAIAQILYDDSDPAALQTLEGIEVTIRSQLQKHVSPALGVFLSKPLPARHRANPDS
jgi:hypothetical protein